MSCFHLKNTVQNYDWGTSDYIPQLLGLANPSKQPYAELWMGAHPKSPSVILLKDSFQNLDTYISNAPIERLGKTAASLYEQKLPFLFKVLSARKALSIQAHPSKRQAETGYFKEQQAGLSLNAFNRNYRDNNHKPELMLALTPFTAMCGFKSLSEISHLFDELGMLSLFPGLNKNLKAFFTDYLNLDEAKVITPSLIEDIKSLRRLNPDMNYILGWVIELYKQYGLHSGILAPLFLNTIQLQPGEAVFIDAGVLHAYLQGSGLELMANSDNVLRCGLTPKYIDKNELLNILDFEHHPPTRIIPQTCNNELIYRTPAAEFELSRIDIYPGVEYNYQIQSGEILLCLNGECIISDCAKLKRGESVFVSADSGDLVITGEALLYRAKTPARKTFS